MSGLHLVVVSQEKKLLDEIVESVTANTTTGEITILPGHIPLFTKLEAGEVQYTKDKQVSESIVVSNGFLTVSQDDSITVMVDSAVLARDISEHLAQQAIAQAKETMRLSQDKRELLLAEASLKRAMLELRVAQKSSRRRL